MLCSLLIRVIAALWIAAKWFRNDGMGLDPAAGSREHQLAVKLLAIAKGSRSGC